MKLTIGMEQRVADALGAESDHIDPESGVKALALSLAVHHYVVAPEQLRHDLGHAAALSVSDVVRLARRQEGVNAKQVTVERGRLSRQPLPALAAGPQGWFIIGRLLDDGVLIQRPGHVVEKIDRHTLDTIWLGELVLLTTREPEGTPAVSTSLGLFPK